MGGFVIRTNQRNESVFWVVGNRKRLLYRWQITTGKFFNKDGKEMSAKAVREAKELHFRNVKAEVVVRYQV